MTPKMALNNVLNINTIRRGQIPVNLAKERKKIGKYSLLTFRFMISSHLAESDFVMPNPLGAYPQSKRLPNVRYDQGCPSWSIPTNIPLSIELLQPSQTSVRTKSRPSGRKATIKSVSIESFIQRREPTPYPLPHLLGPQTLSFALTA